MIKIAHEAPKAIFNRIQEVTDYDYALVHLFEEDPEYLQKFKDALAAGREVILDNSIFELEEAFDADRFAYWINELKPTWYIVPDSLENYTQTMENMADWNEKYADKVPGKKIGVVQGKTYSEIVSCYEYMNTHGNVDMIAKDGVINPDMPHHLLGCGLPQEFQFYREAKYDWIYSLDTSNPVVHGLKEIWYKDQGLWDKESQKLFTMINSEVSEEQMNVILHNVSRFRWFANGNAPVDNIL